jgi:hypothetical protein
VPLVLSKTMCEVGLILFCTRSGAYGRHAGERSAVDFQTKPFVMGRDLPDYRFLVRDCNIKMICAACLHSAVSYRPSKSKG